MKANFSLKFKLFDVFILSFVILSIISSIVATNIAFAKKSENTDRIVQIFCRNDVVKEINLEKIEGEKEYILHMEEHDNLRADMIILLSEDKGVCIKEVNCLDYRCKKAGWISKYGQQLVCLPNQVRVYIESSDGNVNQDIILGG